MVTITQIVIFTFIPISCLLLKDSIMVAVKAQLIIYIKRTINIVLFPRVMLPFNAQMTTDEGIYSKRE